VNGPEWSSAVGLVRHAFDYRTAAHNGRIDPRGAAVPRLRRLGRFMKKYLF
jgi:hypothetical protein